MRPAARRARRRARHGSRDDPRVPAPDGARRRRRELVHAQAPAPEPRRRGRVRGGRRVREELEGLRPDGRRRPARVDRRADRGRGAPVRRRPRGGRLRTGSLPATLRNTEIANQANLDVVINSNDPDYTDDTDYTDGGGTPPQGNPCYMHPTGDDISARRPLDGRARQGARPPVALRPRRAPALAQRRAGAGRDPPRDQRPPVPAARRAEQRDHQGAGALLQRVHRHATQLAKHDLAPLPDTPYQGSGSRRGHALGPPERRAASATPTRAVSITLPTLRRLRPGLPARSAWRCGSRAATRSTSRRNTCAQLLAMQYADCFTRLSQIRDLERRQLGQRDPDRRRPPDGRLRDAPAHDAYFGTLPVAATDCRFGAELYVNWGDRDNPPDLDVDDNFTVTVNGVAGGPAGSARRSGRRIHPLLGPRQRDRRDPGRQHVTVTATGTTTTTSTAITATSVRREQPVRGKRHRARPPGVRRHPGDGRRGRARPHVDRPVACRDRRPAPATPYATVTDRREHASPSTRRSGSARVLRTGVYTTLRLDDPQANQTLRCDPNFSQGQEFSAFRYGCEPWYGENHFNGDVHQPPDTTRPRGGTRHEDVPAGRPVVLLRRPGRGLRRQLEQQPVALRPDRAGPLDRSDRRRHRRGDRQLRQHPQQLVPDLRLQLRRQLRRLVGDRRREQRQLAGTRRGAARRTRGSSTCSSSRTRRARA